MMPGIVSSSSHSCQLIWVEDKKGVKKDSGVMISQLVRKNNLKALLMPSQVLTVCTYILLSTILILLHSCRMLMNWS